MKTNTLVDTIKLKVEFVDRDRRRLVVDSLTRLTDDSNDINVRYQKIPLGRGSSYYKEEYRLELDRYYEGLIGKKRTIGIISLGSYGRKDKYGNNYTIFYINVEFAGLVKYHHERDRIARESLLQIVGYFNSERMSYKITQLDIATDIFTKYENVVVLCTRKYPKTAYYKALDKQMNDTTTYIEKIAKDKMQSTSVRSYVYDKTKKENLDYNVTRFEVKLQSSTYADINAIMGVLDRYHILFINKAKVRKQVKEQFDSYDVVRRKDIQRMDINKYRIYPNIASIKVFFDDLYTARGERRVRGFNLYK
jgi:hypothetical protein